MESSGLEIVFPAMMDGVRSMTYDEQEIREAVVRYRSHAELVAYIPLLRDGFYNVLRTQGLTIDRANEILLDLEQALSNQ